MKEERDWKGLLRKRLTRLNLHRNEDLVEQVLKAGKSWEHTLKRDQA